MNMHIVESGSSDPCGGIMKGRPFRSFNVLADTFDDAAGYQHVGATIEPLGRIEQMDILEEDQGRRRLVLVVRAWFLELRA
jgi:hypothetical protein